MQPELRLMPDVRRLTDAVRLAMDKETRFVVAVKRAVVVAAAPA